MSLLYHAYVYLEFLILACTIYILAPNTLHKTIGEFSMSIDGKTIKVINAPILHCKNCDLVVVDDEIKNNAKEFAKIYLSDNILDYAECEAGTMIPIMNLLF